MAKQKDESRSAAQSSAAGSVPDPIQLWREWVDRTERQWNSTLNELTGSEGFSHAQGRFFEGLLALQSQMNSATERYFALINLPTRTDILSLGQQLATVEERLVELERMVRDLSSQLPGEARSESPPPPALRRTRKAPRTEERDESEPEPKKDKKPKKRKGRKKGKDRPAPEARS